MHEVVAPTRKKLDAEFARGFEGMTDAPVRLSELADTREQFIDTIIGKMPEAHRNLLVAFVEGKEDWAALGVADAAKLPAIRWRQQNLGMLTAERRAELARLLLEALSQESRADE